MKHLSPPKYPVHRTQYLFYLILAALLQLLVYKAEPGSAFAIVLCLASTAVFWFAVSMRLLDSGICRTYWAWIWPFGAVVTGLLGDYETSTLLREYARDSPLLFIFVFLLGLFCLVFLVLGIFYGPQLLFRRPAPWPDSDLTR